MELVQIADEVFARFGINVCIKLNNRKILAGMAEVIGQPERIVDITVAIDKLDKIGLEKVNAELADKGLSTEAIEKLQPILALSGNNQEKLEALKTILATSEVGMKGVEEMETLFTLLQGTQMRAQIELDLTLARGLNYYTGTIIEVKALDVVIGSITGGGRYDNLTGVFGMDGVSGVGISFGADRIYDVLNQLDLYPADSTQGSKIIFLHFGEAEKMYALPWLNALRKQGIAAEIYPDNAKFKKQMQYANDRGFAYVAIVGESEMQENVVMLKNMKEGTQEKCSLSDLIAKLH